MYENFRHFWRENSNIWKIIYKQKRKKIQMRHFCWFSNTVTYLCFYYRQRRKYQKCPDKSEISSPCGFEHIVNIGSKDYGKFFSLQTFVNSKKQKKKSHYGKSRWAPQPPKAKVAWLNDFFCVFVRLWNKDYSKLFNLIQCLKIPQKKLEN